MARKPKVTTSKLDTLFSLIMRSKGRCDFCGKSRHVAVLQCLHGFSRRYRGTRWEEDANFCLCSGCHVMFTYDPIAWDNWMRAVWGDEKYWEVRRRAQAITKPDKQAIYERLKARLAELEDAG